MKKLLAAVLFLCLLCTAAFAETLVKEGGPAVDTMTKLFGAEAAGRVILRHMYGTED